MSLISLARNNDIDGVRYYDNTVNEINFLTNGQTALIFASRSGYTEIVKLLLTNKTININTQDNNNYTALMYASRSGYTEIVKLLLTNKTINVNIQDNYKNTALIFASINNNIEVVKLLLEHKNINVHLQDNYGKTVLLWASRFENIEIIKLLLAKGATIPSKFSYSNDMNEVLTNWKTYLPKWDRFKTYKYYPKEFNEIIIQWLLICKRKNFVSKDIKLLMIEYLAESWKLN